MNEKANILDAWIAVEQFSEGDIRPIDKNYKNIDEKKIYSNSDFDWKSYFLDEMNAFIKKENICQEKQGEVSLIMYFGIFDFSEVITIFKNIYKIKDTNEELKNGAKFTLSLSFDRNLNFISDKLFLTMSGYIREKKDIPKNLYDIENNLKDKLHKDFEDKGFNSVFKTLKEEYKVDKDSFKMMFVKNIDHSNIGMHSFFIDDLKKAKDLETHNLNRYINGFCENRINLDANMNSPNYNPNIFYDILQPKYYPMGRFPSNTSYALSFMQQAAVNLYLNYDNDMLSINGPPGTGKTTLLKDLFADLIVRQAYEMTKNIQDSLKREYTDYEEAKIAVIPKSISKNNIIVVSSNNGAVQNIVRELPVKKDIDEKFISLIENLNYFTSSANSEFKKIYNNTTKRYDYISPKKDAEKNWGMISIEGGSYGNITKLLNKIDSMINELNEWNLTNEEEKDIINEFNSIYQNVSSYKNRIQEIFLEFKQMYGVKQKIEDTQVKLKAEEMQAGELYKQSSEVLQKINIYEKELQKIHEEKRKIQEKLKFSEMEMLSAKRNYDVVLMQKPKENLLSKINRFIGKSNNQEYYEKLNQANETLNKYEKANRELFNASLNIDQNLECIEKNIEYLNFQKEELNNAHKNRISEYRQIIKESEKQIIEYNTKLKHEKIQPIDFNLSYDDLQKSNPWFNKEFRLLQTKLFISALRIRKLYLFKNKKHLKAAMNIFDKQREYIGKNNELIKAAWEWINLAIPIVSSTFASFGRMFKYFDANSLGALFIDEAGQALPQASVGSIFRSSKIMAVGDPSQIKPVLTLNSEMMNIISRKYKVNETFVSNKASTQTLMDRASKYGFQKNKEEWIGIPLWVHRRSNYPMFSISNTIAYNGLMVQGKNHEKAKGRAVWYDVKGIAIDKYVEEQGNKLVDLIKNKLLENQDLKNQIYVITPFKNIVNRLISKLSEIDFVITDENKKPANVGTVHTFQGKEAKIVYFVLGADTNSKGAARWAFSDPNIVNVAATRAKEEFYIIGDKTLYSELGSTIASLTINIIDNYNDKKNEDCKLWELSNIKNKTEFTQ